MAKKPIKITALDVVIAKLNQTKPKGKTTYSVSRTKDQIKSRIKYVLTTGIDPIDNACGGNKVPGFPFGRIVEVYGLDASGKTAIAMLAAVRAQTRSVLKVEDDGTLTPLPDDHDVTAVFIDNEQSLTEDDKITINGIRMDAALVSCDTVDEVFKTIDVAMRAVQAYEEKTGRTQLLVIIVDTIAGTSSKEELVAKWGKDDYPRQPKQLRQGFRKLVRLINSTNTCVICTNQVSDSYKQKIGANRTNVPDDDDFNSFGGRALKYYARLRLFVYKLSSKYKINKGARYPQGFMGGVLTTKNSQFPPHREARFVLRYDKGIDNEFSTFETLRFAKLIERDDDGGYVFYFAKNGVKTTTFGTASVADEEESGGKRRNPYMATLAAWPSFYAEHRVDIDSLYAVYSDMLNVLKPEGAPDEEAKEDGMDETLIGDETPIDDETDEV